MPLYDQSPGELSLRFRRGDDFSALIDTSLNMAGYSVTAEIISAVSGASVMPFTVTIPDAAAGQVNIALTDSQTAMLDRGTYTWEMEWVETNGTRTGLAGFVEVV